MYALPRNGGFVSKNSILFKTAAITPQPILRINHFKICIHTEFEMNIGLLNYGRFLNKINLLASVK